MRKRMIATLAWASGLALCLAAAPPAPAADAPAAPTTPAAPVSPGSSSDALPSAEAVRSAQSMVKQVFRDESRRSDPKARAALLAKMKEQACDPKNEPAVQYAILLEVANVAASAGDADSVVWASDELARRYPRASVEVRFIMIDTAARGAKAAGAGRELGEALLALVDDAGWAGDFPTALRAAERARPLLLPAKNAAEAAYVAEKIEVFHELAADAEAVKREAKEPENARSPGELTRTGAFLCFGCDDWKAGLPMLAKGDDKPLAAAAVLQLTGAEKPADQVAVADAYMEIARAKGRSPLVRSGTASDAGWLYQKASGALSGLSKAYAEKKRAEADRIAVWVPRSMAVARLRAALLSFRWGWGGPDVQMTFHGDGTVSHRGMHGRWEIAAPRLVVLHIDNGDTMYLHFDAMLTHYTSLGRGFGGDQLAP